MNPFYGKYQIGIHKIMPPIKYVATITPNFIEPGDKIKIKGIVLDNAEEFSINFVNENCKDPADITYHFKWLLDERIIVENFKANGIWIDHIETPYDELDGPVFELEFAFQEGFIDVYKIYDSGHNRITTYETQFELNEIKALQVWGDVKKIKESLVIFVISAISATSVFYLPHYIYFYRCKRTPFESTCNQSSENIYVTLKSNRMEQSK